MSEIIFGTPEHVAGLSRKALEEDFQWVNGRRMELEGECERLDAENAKLRELAKSATFALLSIEQFTSVRLMLDGTTFDGDYFVGKLRELGIEVDE